MKPRETMSDSEELVHRWFNDLFNRGDLSVADEILAEDVAYHGPESITPGDLEGRDAVREYVDGFRDSFPDIWYTAEQVYDADGALCVRWSASGTQEGEMEGMDSSGETFDDEGLNLFEVDDGEIVAVRSEWDTLKMVRELEIVPGVGSVEE